jgi:hypothetical protein
MASILSNLLNKAANSGAVKSAISSARSATGGSIPIPPDVLRSYLRSQPAYNDNRERAAVVLGQGFGIYDGYVKAKPFLFAGSLASAAFSGFALYKRHKKGAEAITLHSANLVASLIVAYLTRPGTTPPAPAGTSSGDVAGYNVIAGLDKKRAALKAKDPQFADKVFARLAQMPGVREQLAASPLVAAAIT